MTLIQDALVRLRDTGSRAATSGSVRSGLDETGVRFAAIGGSWEKRWDQAVAELEECVRPVLGEASVLTEGGPYAGSWLEGTATISVEVLSRFAPAITRDSQLQFARLQRDDGMLPYKVTDDGPGFSQIQIVTPLARSVWNHYTLNESDRDYLRTMYDAMSRYDDWLVRFRDTGRTGAVEAFCTFDTGHDLSPRFWFAPERCFQGDATRCDPDSPTVPYVAPDLTANVACQRRYLARIADELGEDSAPWRAKASASLAALWEQCYDDADGIFYDRDRAGRLVRIQSDVLLRVLACEVGDEPFFEAALDRHLMNTGKFLSHYGFTSLAMDDPRFDQDFARNSWAGPVNFLSLIRAPHAFEQHGHVAELAASVLPTLTAVAEWDRFPQTLDPWSGAPGFTSSYSPSILWFLDAIERHFGVLPRPDGELWFSGLTPTRLDHGQSAHATAYARTIDDRVYEQVGDDERNVVFRAGSEQFSFPRGWRIVTDRSGEISAVVGLAAHPVSGRLTRGGTDIGLTVAPNERVEIDGRGEIGRSAVAFVGPHA